MAEAVTCIVKNNVLSGPLSWRTTEIAQEYPEVEQDVATIDAFTQWLTDSSSTTMCWSRPICLAIPSPIWRRYSGAGARLSAVT